MWIYRRYHVSEAIMNHPQIFHKWVVKNHWHIDYGLVYHCLTNMGWSTWFPLRGKHSGWWLVSGLYWGLYDRLWEFLATSNYSFTAQVALEILGLLSGFCWVGWRFEASWGRTRNEIPSKSFVFFCHLGCRNFTFLDLFPTLLASTCCEFLRRWEDGDWAEHVEWRWQKCGHLTQKTMCKQCTNAGMWPKNRDAWDQPCQFLNVTRAAPCWE